MTKEEFIQNAALTILSTNQKSPEFIASYAMRLAKLVYMEDDEETDKNCFVGMKGISVINIIQEVERIDKENTERRIREAKEHGHRGYHPKNKGYASILKKALESLNIATVDELMSIGRAEICRCRNVGTGCVEALSNALYNLYNIRF